METYEEKRIVSWICSFMKARHCGKANVICNRLIRANVENTFGIIISDYKVRRIVNRIRTGSLLPGLCSSAKGYYVAATEEELNDCCQSLQNRIDAQQAALDALKAQKMVLFPRQNCKS